MANLANSPIQALETRFASLWRETGVLCDPKNAYIVSIGHEESILFPEIRQCPDLKNIKFHSPQNPKSSQLLAINLFLGLGSESGNVLSRCLNLQTPADHCSTVLEWVDPENLLRQKGTPSQHDVMVDCGSVVFLVEVKLTETGNQPCGTSIKNGECKKPLSQLKCPLQTEYGTRYFEIAFSNNPIYDPDRLEMVNDGCPFLHGEHYQLMRHLTLCAAKTAAEGRPWIPCIAFPGWNKCLNNEIDEVVATLQNSESLGVISLEKMLSEFPSSKSTLKDWLGERYLFSEGAFSVNSNEK